MNALIFFQIGRALLVRLLHCRPFIFTVSILFSHHALFAETIVMGYFPLRPFQYAVSEEEAPRGASITYFNAIAKKMGYEVEWVGPLPLPRLLLYVSQGKATKKGIIDGVVTVIDSEEWRENIFFYPDEPYTRVQSSLFLTRDNELSEITGIEDLDGYTIGFHCGAPRSPFFQSSNNHVLFDCMADTSRIENNIDKLLLGRIDAYYDLNEHSFLFEALLLGKNDKIKIIPLPEPPQNIFIGFSKSSPKGALLLEQYNIAVKDLDLNYDDILKNEMNINAP